MAKCLSQVKATNIRMEAHINTFASTVATSATLVNPERKKRKKSKECRLGFFVTAKRILSELTCHNFAKSAQTEIELLCENAFIANMV